MLEKLEQQERLERQEQQEQQERPETLKRKEEPNILRVYRDLMALMPETVPRYAPTDVGNANLFADVYANRLRFVPERKLWYVYTGKRWEPDLGGLQAMEFGKDLAEALYIHMLRLGGEVRTGNGTRQQLIHAADRWRQRRAREVILRDAASIYPVRMGDFDRNPYLFNCQNGTLDLLTGAFRPHDPEDLLASLAGVEYDPQARSALWESTVDQIFAGDQAMAEYLQKALGYGLTGDTSEECFFLLYGPTTRNGKGTVMETYMGLLGEYGKAARPETIALRQNYNASGPSEDIAKLAGARAVNIAEPDRNLRLSAALVKTLTGSDTITARYLHENSFEFRPRFKLFIHTNHLPETNDITVFQSGRVKVLPFPRHFSPEEQDKTLKKRLEAELSGVLNWCVEGLRRKREEGFALPPAAEAATSRYWQESDSVARFVEERLAPDPAGEVLVTEAYRAYQAWCEENGQRAPSLVGFRRELARFGEIKRKRPKGTGREGRVLSLFHGYSLAS